MSELGKKSTLHIADQCFSSFGVSLMFPHNSVYATLINDALLRFSASGLGLKIANDMAWDLQRSDSQKLLDSTKSKSFSMSDVEERKLNLAYTEGMFLLMAIGYILAGSVLFSEIVGGCAKSCRAFLRRGSVVSTRIQRGSAFSLSRNEPKTFADKLKRGIRRRLRPKPKPQEPEEPVEPEEINDETKRDESEKQNENGQATETTELPLKGPTSFCTLKRIMLMRKRRREEKKAAKEIQISTIEIAKLGEGDKSTNCYENAVDLEEGAVGGEHVTIENEKSGEIGDADDSLMGSTSVCSDAFVIREETEVQLNQCSTSVDRDNSPPTQFPKWSNFTLNDTNWHLYELIQCTFMEFS